MGIKSNRPLGILALGRPTFDVAYAEEMRSSMLGVVRRAGRRLVGSETMLFDAAAARDEIARLRAAGVEDVLVLQLTFTDALVAAEAARAFAKPLSIWAVPEPRVGGRLRLNAFCGLNLAAHAIGKTGRDFGWLYAAPDALDIDARVGDLLDGRRVVQPVVLPSAPTATGGSPIEGARIARLGSHPDGFDTCAYDPATLQALAGVEVEAFAIADLFERAAAVPTEAAAAVRRDAEDLAAGLDQVDQAQLDRSLRLKSAIETLRTGGNFDALAIRCWPETFTEYGGAVCAPVSMMGEARVPCACEADIHGALSSLLLQRVADAPAFLTDMVDFDVEDDTAVVWHCGQAPTSMADPATTPRATIHTNRKMPLLFEFALKPGRVTFFRLSQARGIQNAVIGIGTMLERPMAFTGTSGVVRFDSGTDIVLSRLMDAALEHHLALTYGDHREALRAAARQLGLPVLEL